MKIGIIGAGISGLVLANILDQLGLSFELYEQDDSLNKVQRDIVLTPNASQILHKFGFLKIIQQVAHQIQIDEYANENLESFFKIEPEKIIGNDSYPFLSLSNEQFKSICIQDLYEKKIHFSHTITDVSQRLDKVLIKFANGESAEFDYVIAADGMKSKIREITFPYNSPSFGGETSISIKVDLEKFPMSPHLALHLLSYRKFFSIHALPDKLWSCHFISPFLESSLRDSTKIQENLLHNFKNFNQSIFNLIKQHHFKDCLIEKNYTHASHLEIDQGRLFFIGDAAHVISPLFHQDTAQAIEGAWRLGVYLSEVLENKNDLKSYRNERKKRTQSAIQLASTVQELGSFQEKGLKSIGQGVLRNTPQLIYDYFLKKQYIIE
jgi:2-polyprenyl-6-methoxyphenol hydroxylase-like FAD-dependent oxidoreductase